MTAPPRLQSIARNRLGARSSPIRIEPAGSADVRLAGEAPQDAVAQIGEVGRAGAEIIVAGIGIAGDLLVERRTPARRRRCAALDQLERRIAERAVLQHRDLEFQDGLPVGSAAASSLASSCAAAASACVSLARAAAASVVVAAIGRTTLENGASGPTAIPGEAGRPIRSRGCGIGMILVEIALDELAQGIHRLGRPIAFRPEMQRGVPAAPSSPSP